MEQTIVTPYTISDFLEWDASGQLVLTPKFQRRDVWIPKAKSYLIDSILRLMPIPPLFIRLIIDPIRKRSTREVVDGQQRLRTVLSYIHGDFPVMKVHNPEYGGMSFADLPDEIQRRFLGYNFSVNVLQEVSDSEVLSIFARLNTYTERLTSQELRNAQYFGAFKQVMYNIAHQHYSFWLNNHILTNKRISRMGDAEFVSELVVSMLDGVRQTKVLDLKEFYTRFDDDFPQSQKISNEFLEIINLIGNLFGEKLKSSQFRRAPLFYSLFCALYDARFGLPKSKRPRIDFTAGKLKKLYLRIIELENMYVSQTPPEYFMNFIDATKVSTANPAEKRIRHEFLWNYLLTPLTK